MLDDEDGLAGIGELVELRVEQRDIGGVEARGGLVQDVDSVAATGVAGALELGGELDALGLAAGELRGALAEAQVAEADGLEGGECAGDGRFLGEDRGGVVDGEREDVGDGVAVPGYLEGFRVIAGAVAVGAR